MRPEALIATVRRTIATHRLLSQGLRVIIAVSGGMDSVALLHVLQTLQPAWRLTLRIAHLDHGLREPSAQDAAFVQALGARWKIPVTVERRDVQARCAHEGWSLEDGARRIRYQFFLEVARRHSASHVALAHTADDQAETVLLRLIRGTGLMGLGAIPIRRRLDDVAELSPDGQGIWVVRPLLDVWRRDIAAYVKQAKLAYREDATNADHRFVRNRIRHTLLPLLEREYNPNIRAGLTTLAEQSRWDYAYLQEAAGRQWKRLANTTQPSEVTISISGFLRQPKAMQRQLVRHAFQQLRGDVGQFEFRHWLEAERLFTDRPVGTRLDLPGGVQLSREKAGVRFRLASLS